MDAYKRDAKLQKGIHQQPHMFISLGPPYSAERDLEWGLVNVPDNLDPLITYVDKGPFSMTLQSLVKEFHDIPAVF